jgi:hypothetical protein
MPRWSFMSGATMDHFTNPIPHPNQMKRARQNNGDVEKIDGPPHIHEKACHILDESTTLDKIKT